MTLYISSREKPIEVFQVLSGMLSKAQDISTVRQLAFLAVRIFPFLEDCEHVLCTRTHTYAHAPHLLFPHFSWHINWLSVFPPQAKKKKKKTNPVETHFLAKLQPTKGKQAGVSPDYRPNHQSARLPGQQRKDAVRGTVLADPVSTASGARSLRVQASCLERQPLSPD